MNFYQVLKGLNHIQVLYGNYQDKQRALTSNKQNVDTRNLQGEDVSEQLEALKIHEEKLNALLEVAYREENALFEQIKKLFPDQKDEEQSEKLLTIIVNNIRHEKGHRPKKEIKEEATILHQSKGIEKLQNEYGKFCDNAVYKSLLPYTRLAYLFEGKGNAEEHAFKLATLFCSQHKALEYLKRYATSSFDKFKMIDYQTFIHDALLFDLPPHQHCDFKTWCRFAQRIDYMLDNEFKEMMIHADVIENAIKKEGILSNAKLHHKNSEIRQEELARLATQREKVAKLKMELSPKLREWKKLKIQQKSLKLEESIIFHKLSKEISGLRIVLANTYSGVAFSSANLDMLRAYYEKHVVRKSFDYKYLFRFGSRIINSVKNMLKKNEVVSAG